MRKEKSARVIRRIACFDLAALVILSAAFLAVYDWIPSGKFSQAVSAVTRLTATEAPETPVPTATPSPAPTPTPTPTPSPTPEPGDFSATFPDYDTGESADYTCQTDQYRIAITETAIGECVVFIADIYVKDIHLIQTAFANAGFESGSSKYQYITEMAQANGAIFAVSGDYCTVRSSGIIIRNGELLRDENYDDLCALMETGELVTYNKREITAEELMKANAWQTWCFGPPLLEDGKAMEINHRLSRLNPRCAIGYYEPGHYCFIIADGRQKYYSIGMTLTDLSQLCEDLGLKAAYNLDGGMTASMVFGNEKVNQPPIGGRRVGDIIYIEDLFSVDTEAQSDEG
ncbi:MAG TPA: phosphodiester glycosidase family protein [Eubacteriales bacterium]|nr:phosphodiester glycosidase family protein [Eubacteriales bacterium]